MKLIEKTIVAGSMIAVLGNSLSAADRPNVLLIYGDDVGYGDVGAYGAKLIPTPNIDKLAKQGLMFTDAHCSSATCTPSRFSLLTGLSAFRSRVHILRGDAKLSIPTNKLTLPKLFKKAGYQTAAIGKWHLGLGAGRTPTDWNKDVKPGPLEIGFDYSFLMPATTDRVPCVYLENHNVVNLDPNDPITVSYGKALPVSDSVTNYPDGKKDRSAMTFYKSTQGHNNSIINGIGRIGYMTGGKSALWKDEKISKDMLAKTKEFISKTQSEKKPFFVYFASQCIHVPRVPSPEFVGKTKLGYRGDSMVEFDWVTGQLMKFLKDKGLDQNTIVIFSSDNGPVYDDGYDDGSKVRTSTKESDNGHDGSGPYRGGKYQIYEGGTRVPLIVRWPGHITPGEVSTALISQTDFLASFADLLGVKISEKDSVDSRNYLQALLGKDKVGAKYIIEDGQRTLALRMGDWKYIAPTHSKKKKAKKDRLYNLKKDVGEQHNVIDANPEIAKDMKKTLNQYISNGRMRK
jgi:arylsulfatase A-like enzyme